jgi:ABC-type transport system substrate-binding protein
VVAYDSVNGIRLEPTHQGPLIELHSGSINDVYDFRADEQFTLFPNMSNNQRLLLQAADAQLHSVMQNESVALWFNVANSANPQPAFDPETDERIEQEPNMVFADRNLRLAVAHLIDMDSIIADVFYGEATSISSTLPPTSWVANNDLERYPYDFEQATKLLHDAGWHLVAGRSPRLCIDCGTAPDETPLRITLAYPLQDLQIAQVADRVASELWRAGFSVDVYDTDYVTRQRFDLTIVWMMNRYPAALENSLAFTPEEDNPIEGGQNFTSYYNATLTDLLLEAETVPGCEVTARQELYQQVQAILHDEIIGLGLYTPQTVVAAQPSLQNFNPQPGQMLWQVTEWVVWDD